MKHIFINITLRFGKLLLRDEIILPFIFLPQKDQLLKLPIFDSEILLVIQLHTFSFCSKRYFILLTFI